MKETWVVIPDFDQYLVSDHGRIMSDATQRIMVQSINQQGVAHVALNQEGYQQRRSVALLVARAFLPAPEASHFDTPIHLDGDRSNCHVRNLMWRPRWLAIEYHKQMKRGPRSWSDDAVIDLKTEIIYKSMWEAATALGLLESEIFSSVTNWTPVSPGGYQFRFLEEVEQDRY